jgi:DNA-binding winged helix-turn-helix (wHTH) protein/tetratricopeptide (TPR) repeat protein
MNATATISFGGFRLNKTRGCLEDAAGAERFLRPKSYRLLEILSERRGELLTKDELVRQVWPDVFVSDDSLAQCVRDIRRALGDEGASLLRTVPRRGYMLTGDAAPAARIDADKRAPKRAAGAVALCLIVGLGLWWAGGPAFTASDLRTDPVTDPSEARIDLLLDDRNRFRREYNDEARVLLQAILARDPGDADAWARLGLTYWREVQHLSWGGGRREMAQALDMVERAIALGADTRSHRLLAEMRLLAPFPEARSRVDALANARAAVAIAPAEAANLAILAHALALTGRADEAVRTIEQARRMNPGPPEWYREVAGLAYLVAGEPGRAAEEFGPLYGAGTFVSARWWPGWLFAASLAHAGRVEEASAIIRTARAHWPEQTVAAVAQSLHGLDEPAAREIVLGGLGIAGMPD